MNVITWRQHTKIRHQLCGLSGSNWWTLPRRWTGAPVVLVLQPEWLFSITKVSSSSTRPGPLRAEPPGPSSQGNLSRYLCAIRGVASVLHTSVYKVFFKSHEFFSVQHLIIRSNKHHHIYWCLCPGDAFTHYTCPQSSSVSTAGAHLVHLLHVHQQMW